MERSAVSRRLRVLRALGLVAGTRRGRSVIYSFSGTHVALPLEEAVYLIERIGPGAPDVPAATCRRCVRRSKSTLDSSDDARPLDSPQWTSGHRRLARDGRGTRRSPHARARTPHHLRTRRRGMDVAQH
jgi:hypothetical protein